MDEGSCSRCGKHLPVGSLKFLVTISITADFDGHISGNADPDQIRRLLQDAESRDEQDLENDVFQKMAYVLCAPCRNIFITQPVGTARGSRIISKGIIH